MPVGGNSVAAPTAKTTVKRIGSLVAEERRSRIGYEADSRRRRRFESNPLDWDGNAVRIAAAIDDARRQGTSILCLPEMCITGYGCEDAFLSPGLQATAVEVLHELVGRTRGMIVSFVCRSVT